MSQLTASKQPFLKANCHLLSLPPARFNAPRPRASVRLDPSLSGGGRGAWSWWSGEGGESTLPSVWSGEGSSRGYRSPAAPAPVPRLPGPQPRQLAAPQPAPPLTRPGGRQNCHRPRWARRRRGREQNHAGGRALAEGGSRSPRPGASPCPAHQGEHPAAEGAGVLRAAALMPPPREPDRAQILLEVLSEGHQILLWTPYLPEIYSIFLF